MASVVFEHVSKRFGDVVAVDDLELEIADEEFLVLLGPSGCGKSTALRMVAGLEEPTEGAILIGDQRVDGIDPKDRDLAMVFQSYALYPHMSVRQNIEFPLRTRGVPKEERATTVASAAEALGLTGLLDRKPGQLSGGQRQRVALARAIVRDPEAFLMDEPLSNLDAKLRVETRAELVQLQQRLAATVVYVTHDQVEAPQEVYARPANLFVARFIGTPPMNTIPGELAGANADVIVGVRPEHLTVSPRGSGIDATVVAIEALGHERHVICRVADGSTVIARQGMEVTAPAPNDEVGLVFAPEHAHHFDAVDGARLG